MRLESILSEDGMTSEIMDDLEQSLSEESIKKLSNAFEKYEHYEIRKIPLEDELQKLHEAFLEGKTDLSASEVLEKIVRLHARPALFIKNNSFPLPNSTIWTDKLSRAKSKINKVLPAVGRIEMKNHPSNFTWAGTAWLVRDDILVTNKHVAENFSYRYGNNFRIKDNMKITVDFLKEQGSNKKHTFNIEEILHIEDDGSPDLAFLKVKKSIVQLPTPIELITSIHTGQDIVTIGYPAQSESGVAKAIRNAIFENIYGTKRLMPGRVVRVSNDIIEHDCSTLEGCSGSPLIDLNSGKAAGIHFGYKDGSGGFNEAVPSEKILECLSQL